MDETQLERLLINTGAILTKHYKDSREKGEDFNVFSVLGMENNETKTHSAMLVALLNPKGNHYHGSRSHLTYITY